MKSLAKREQHELQSSNPGDDRMKLYLRLTDLKDEWDTIGLPTNTPKTICAPRTSELAVQFAALP